MKVTRLPRFRLLAKVHSLRLAGKRVFPGDEFDLTEEQAKRLNTDIFVKVEPLRAAAVVAPEGSLLQTIWEFQAKPQIEAPANVVPKPKKSGKRPAFARTNTP